MSNSNPITYYVNPEKRVVVARIDNLHAELIRAVRKDIARSAVGLNAYELTVNLSDIIEKAIRMNNIPHTITRKAVCAPDGVWNEETGKDLARLYVLETATRYKRLFMINVVNILSKIHSQMCERIDLYADLLEDYAASKDDLLKSIDDVNE